jgi:hypothetical protein
VPGTLSPGSKAAGARSSPLTSNLISRLRMGGAVSRPPHTSSWHDACLSTFETVHFTRYLGGQKEYEMNDTRSMHWIGEKCIQNLNEMVG